MSAPRAYQIINKFRQNTRGSIQEGDKLMERGKFAPTVAYGVFTWTRELGDIETRFYRAFVLEWTNTDRPEIDSVIEMERNTSTDLTTITDWITTKRAYYKEWV